MRTRVLIIAVAGLLLSGSVVLSAGGLDGSLLGRLRLSPVAGPPPPLVLKRLDDGRALSLAELRGRPVLVYFWASW